MTTSKHQSLQSLLSVDRHVLRVRRSLSSRVLSLFVACAVPAFITSCGGGDAPTTPEPAITRVDVTAPTTTLSPGQTAQLTVTARTANGVVTGKPIAYAVSNSSIISVNSSGAVLAVAPGNANVSVSVGGVAGSISFTVVAAGGTVASVSVGLSDPSLIIGNIGQATVTVRDANNAVIALGSRPLTWSSTNTSVATVSNAGIVSAVGVGTTQIRASVVDGANSVVGNANFAVIADPDAKQSVDVSMPGNTFSPADVVVKVNGTVRFIFPNVDHNVIWRPRMAGSPADILPVSNTTRTLTFTTQGVFPYECTLHAGMVGTVVVSP